MTTKRVKGTIKKAYQDKEPVLLAVDCIIFGFDIEGLKLLIFKRHYQPLAGEWSLLGSFVERDENIKDTAHRVLKEVTGFNKIFVEQLHTFGSVARDSGDRVVSIAYWSLIKLNEQNTHLNVEGYEAKWVDFKKVPKLVLDHNEMVNVALSRLRERARIRPIGFELLPDKFTLPQLFNLYQAIYQTTLDDRNFRRKILRSGLLLELGEKDKSTSKRGAQLYKFDYDRYEQLTKEGYLFEI